MRFPRILSARSDVADNSLAQLEYLVREKQFRGQLNKQSENPVRDKQSRKQLHTQSKNPVRDKQSPGQLHLLSHNLVRYGVSIKGQLP